ncbi:hypothetical protein BDZ45DRAFT_677408 [Acephala macrosclerotiorum]|nr:hypothetical protein BDZ45DRAFT_677408 [Acephala macrosclerotiorum]
MSKFFSGNLRRNLTCVPSNAVSQRRRSAPLCSGVTHPRLTLCSGCSVTFLLSLLVTNHDLLTIRLCRAKVVNSTRLCSRGQLGSQGA